MRHVLAAVNSSDLVALLEQTRLTSEEQVGHADSEAAGQFSKYIHIFLSSFSELEIVHKYTFGTAKCPVIEVSSFWGVMIRGIPLYMYAWSVCVQQGMIVQLCLSYIQESHSSFHLLTTFLQSWTPS